MAEGDKPGSFYLSLHGKQRSLEKVFGWAPENSRHLNQMFEKRVREFIDR